MESLNLALFSSPQEYLDEIANLKIRVSQLEKNEQKLLLSNQQLVNAIMISPLPIAISSMDGRYKKVNETFLQKSAYSREEVVDHYASDLTWYFPEERVQFVKLLTEQGYVKAFEVTFKGSGEILNKGIISAELIDFDGEKCILSMFLDASDRIRVENDLRRSQEHLFRLNRALRVKSKCGQIQVHTTDETLLMQKICRVLVDVGGYRLAWVGLVQYDEAKTIKPVAYAGYEEGYLDTLNVTWDENDIRGMGPSGRAIRAKGPVSSQNILIDPAFEVWRKDAQERGYASSLVLPLISEDVVFGAINIYATQPNAFDSEETQLLMEMADDLAYGINSIRAKIERARVEMELQLSEEKLRQSQKLEAIGRLAGGIAHDFNNLLTGISGFTEILLLDPKLSQSNYDDLNEINKASQKASALVQQLLAFSRKQVLQPKMVDLNNIVLDLKKMLVRLIGANIYLETVVDADLGLIKADPGQIEQVIVNLAVNARDAMPNGGRLTIKTRNVSIDSSNADYHSGLLPGNYIQLTVSDTGNGMDAVTLSHIFEPFFTTKELGKGTGLGLSTVYGIVKQSGGHIRVSSEQNKGTSFEIYLPKLEESAASTNSTLKSSQIAVEGSETVLVVEDEAEVRKLVKRILIKNGYNILEAKNGFEALKMYENAVNVGSIRLVLTDLVMPEMGGLELAEHLHKINPDLLFLFMSGYSAKAIEQQGNFDDKSGFLEKPFTLNTLTSKVRHMLNRPQMIDSPVLERY